MARRRATSTAAFALALTVVVLVAGVAAGLPVQQTLVVSDAGSGEQLLAVPVEEGSTVTVAYTHSVEKTPVRDIYTVSGDRLEMTRMEFESYGWGLPARADVELVNGTFVFDPDGTYAELYISPGSVAGHVLYVDGRSYDLVALSDGDAVRLTVERRPAATGVARV